ncbi:MAG: SDR family NAD(P)-dependent oxidoreductase [Bacteroidota bacterium]
MTNKKNIVVVGASRGIGKALVQLLAQHEDHHVIALSRNTKELAAFCDSPENITYGFVDVASAEVHEQLDAVLSQFNYIDVLINNAGKLVNKPFDKLSRAEIDSCYQTNAVGTMYTTQYFIPKMSNRGGHIVNISTVGAFQGSVKFPGLSAYSTSKAGITSFTELFAEEYKETPIKMNCLCLGAVQTEMLSEAFPGLEVPTSPEDMAAYIADFSLTGHQYFNGKILPVSASTP